MTTKPTDEALNRAADVAARDTTFDNIVPEKLWLCLSNQTTPIEPFNKTENRFQVAIQLNGIGKMIGDYFIPGLDPSEGTVSAHINLTWILELLKKARIAKLEAALKEATEALEAIKRIHSSFSKDGKMNNTYKISSRALSKIDEVLK